jgi:hypothetical protein
MNLLSLEIIAVDAPSYKATAHVSLQMAIGGQPPQRLHHQQQQILQPTGSLGLTNTSRH